MNIQIEELKPLLEEISSKIGEGSEFAWEAIVRQQYINGIMGIAYFLIGVLFAYIGYCMYGLFKEVETNEYGDGGEVEFMSMCISFFVAIIFFWIGFTEAIHHLANPEYQAIIDLFNLLN